jgi:hypothetical protein
MYLILLRFPPLNLFSFAMAAQACSPPAGQTHPQYALPKKRDAINNNTKNMKLPDAIPSKPAWMTHLLLSHLSKDNNCPQLVHDLFSRYAAGVEIVVASRYQETKVFHIQKNLHSPVKKEPVIKEIFVQTSLF